MGVHGCGENGGGGHGGRGRVCAGMHVHLPLLRAFIVMDIVRGLCLSCFPTNRSYTVREARQRLTSRSHTIMSEKNTQVSHIITTARADPTLSSVRQTSGSNTTRRFNKNSVHKSVGLPSLPN